MNTHTFHIYHEVMLRSGMILIHTHTPCTTDFLLFFLSGSWMLLLSPLCCSFSFCLVLCINKQNSHTLPRTSLYGMSSAPHFTVYAIYFFSSITLGTLIHANNKFSTTGMLVIYFVPAPFHSLPPSSTATKKCLSSIADIYLHTIIVIMKAKLWNNCLFNANAPQATG